MNRFVFPFVLGLLGALPAQAQQLLPQEPTFTQSQVISILKALDNQSSEYQKFVGLNPKATISEIQITSQQDGGYQLTMSSQTCDSLPVVINGPELPQLPQIPQIQPLPGQDVQGIPPLGGSAPGGILPACTTYAKLIINATYDAGSDGFEYRTLFNSTIKKSK